MTFPPETCVDCWQTCCSSARKKRKILRPTIEQIAEKVGKFDENAGLLPQAKAKAKAKAKQAAKTAAAPKAAAPKPKVSEGGRGRGRGRGRSRGGGRWSARIAKGEKSNVGESGI